MFGQYGQLGANQTPECNCLWGTPVIDANGNCGCMNDFPPPTYTTAQNQTVKGNPQIIYVQVPTQTQPTTTQTAQPATDDTFFGIPKWVAIVVGVGGGLYVLSQMGDK